MTTAQSTRPLDQRFVPPVAGIDLEHSLNYIDLDDVSEEFIYGHYTSRRLFYAPGSRPTLEQVAEQVTSDTQTELQKTQALASWVATQVKWAGFKVMDKNQPLPPDQCPSEEQLIGIGYGWCNEQARLFCTLCQICGIPSRMVFASDKAVGHGHCIAEALVDGAWMAVDPSFGFCFVMDDTPVRASRIFRDPESRSYFTPIYTKLCHQLLEDIGPYAAKAFAMAAAENPLQGFSHLGYHNYFAH